MAQSTQRGSDLSSEVDRAILLARAGNLDDAITVLREVLKSEPDHINATRNLALMYHRKHQLDSSIIIYRRVLKLDSLDMKSMTSLGRVLVDSGLVDEAIELYRRLLQRDSLDERVYIELAFAHGEKGDLTQSASALLRAVSLNPYNATAHHNLGVVYRQDRQWSRAIDHFVQCRDIHLGYPNLEMRLHVLLDTAKPYLEDWVGREPDSPDAHYYLGYSLCYEGEYKDAVKEAKKAIKLDPTRTDYYKALGLFRESQRKSKDARKAYQKCLEIDSTCWACSVALSSLLRGKKPEAALALIESTARDYPNVYAVQMELAVCYSIAAYKAASGEDSLLLERAAEAFLRALSLLTTRPDGQLHYNIAATYRNLGKLDLAQEYAAEAQHLGYGKASSLLELISSEIEEN